VESLTSLKKVSHGDGIIRKTVNIGVCIAHSDEKQEEGILGRARIHAHTLSV
jgi:hypothetical protein